VINRSSPGDSTLWPLSRHFDSSAALLRLTKPSAKDRDKLARLPRPPGLLMRILRDPDLALATLLILAAVASAGLIAAA
jgi:hypothetical protein